MGKNSVRFRETLRGVQKGRKKEKTSPETATAQKNPQAGDPLGNVRVGAGNRRFLTGNRTANAKASGREGTEVAKGTDDQPG